MKLTMKRRYLLDLLKQFLKYGLETKKKKKKKDFNHRQHSKTTELSKYI